MKTLAKPSRVIGPEDVREGQYITVTHTMYEFLSDRCAPEYDQEVTATRVTLINGDAGQPLKVVAVCLPFVLTRNTAGLLCSLDLRQHHIAKLTKGYGRKAFKKKKSTNKQTTKT